MGKVLSVDLAIRKVRDVGVCLIEERRGRVADVRFVDAERELGLQPSKSAKEWAEAINSFCGQNRIDVLLIDGPQGWKDPGTRLKHSRACERALHTPGKVGIDEEHVKPHTWRCFAKFSIDLFAELERLGAVRVTKPIVRTTKRALLVVESFPTSAWRSLCIIPLPKRTRTTDSDMGCRLYHLQSLYGFQVSRLPTHDELQALVAGLAGVAILAANTEGYIAEGAPPRNVDGVVVEGYIVNPKIGENAWQ